MNGYEIPNLRFSLPAGGAVKMHRFVAANTDGAGIQAIATSKIIGASMNETATGEVLEIADGIVMVETAAIIAAGIDVSSDADGKAIVAVATTQDAGTKAVTFGTVVAGTAVTGGAVGALIAVKIK